MGKPPVVIIGAGIIGLAHAITAREHGHDVVVLERDGRALGASVRNFGTLWPIGCASGDEREQALFGVRRWAQLATDAGFWFSQQGSLSLAYRDEAWAVLQEFTSSVGDCELLDASAVRHRFPAARPDGLQGAVYSPAEAVVHPPSTLAALADYARSLGIVIHFGTPVVKVHDEAVETSDGRCIAFDRLVIAAGEEMRLLFPEALAAAGVQRCRLQMMRTVPQPAGFALGAVFVSDLTLCHYPAFATCPSTPRLRTRLADELPDHADWGIHVIAAQHDDHTLTLGDSHEYGLDFDPDSHSGVEHLILDALDEFVTVPDLRIASRWHGVYLKSTRGETQVVLHPRARVTMVTAMGGLGMTLSWGLAARTVESWRS
jgi:FAD dependent oxidoreductase TIGR03364